MRGRPTREGSLYERKFRKHNYCACILFRNSDNERQKVYYTSIYR